jgi:hypothetical protein
VTSENPADLDGLWPLPTLCSGPRPGWVRTRRNNGTWGLTCVNSTENGQNGRSVSDDDLCTAPGQLTIDDASAASYEDVAAAEIADKLVQAILRGERPALPCTGTVEADELTVAWGRLAREGRKVGLSLVKDPSPLWAQVADVSQFGAER